MKKRIISLVLAMSFVFASVLSTNAASFSQSGNAKTPTALTYKDVSRLVDVATHVRGKQHRIVNATKYNGSDTIWVVRLVSGSGMEQKQEDYVLNVYPYGRDPETQEVNTLPFKNVEEGTKKFGPAWFYFGVFDDVSHNSCGFVVAERIKRWPNWDDLSFSGPQPGNFSRGIYYTGSYKQESSDSFMEKHINK